MKISNKINKLYGVLITSGCLSLAACNSGTGSAGTNAGTNSTPSNVVHAKASKSIMTINKCLVPSISQGPRNTTYNSDTVVVEINNKCDQDQALSGHTIQFATQDTKGNYAEIADWTSSDHSQLFGISLNALNILEHYIDSTTVLKAHKSTKFTSTRIYTTNNNKNKFDFAKAQATVAIDGVLPSDEPETAEMVVNVDTTAAQCTKATKNKPSSCEGINVDVADATGEVVASFAMPVEGGEKTIDNLNVDQKYSVHATPLAAESISYAPTSDVTIAKNKKNEVGVKYTKVVAPATGNLVVTIPTVLDTYDGTVDVMVVKNGNEVMAQYHLKQGTSSNQLNLPISDDENTYEVKLARGIADPITGQYFVQAPNNIKAVPIRKNKETNFNINLKAVAKKDLKKLTLEVKGLSSNQTAALSFEDATHSYNYVNDSVSNGQHEYMVDSNVLFAIRGSSDTDIVTYGPVIVSKNMKDSIEFNKVAPQPTVEPTVNPTPEPTVDPVPVTPGEFSWNMLLKGPQILNSDGSYPYVSWAQIRADGVNSIYHMQASPNGKLSVIALGDSSVKIYDLDTQTVKFDLGTPKFKYDDEMSILTDGMSVKWNGNNKPQIVYISRAGGVAYFDGSNWNILSDINEYDTIDYHGYSEKEILGQWKNRGIDAFNVDWSGTTPRIAIATEEYDSVNPRGQIFYSAYAYENGKWKQIIRTTGDVSIVSLAPASEGLKLLYTVNETQHLDKPLYYYNNGQVSKIATSWSNSAGEGGRNVDTDWSLGSPRIIYQEGNRVKLLNTKTNNSTVLYTFAHDFERTGPLSLSHISTHWAANDANVKTVFAMQNGAVEYYANGKLTEFSAPIRGWNFGQVISGELAVSWNSGTTYPEIFVRKGGNFNGDVKLFANYGSNKLSQVNINYNSKNYSAIGYSKVIWNSNGKTSKIVAQISTGAVNGHAQYPFVIGTAK